MKKIKWLGCGLLGLILVGLLIFSGTKLRARWVALTLAKNKASLISHAEAQLGVSRASYYVVEDFDGDRQLTYYYSDEAVASVVPVTQAALALAQATSFQEASEQVLTLVKIEKQASDLAQIDQVSITLHTYRQVSETDFGSVQETRGRPLFVMADQTLLSLADLFKEKNQAKPQLLDKMVAALHDDPVLTTQLVESLADLSVADLSFDYKQGRLGIVLPTTLGDISQISLPLDTLYDVIDSQYLTSADLKRFEQYQNQKLVALTFDDGPDARTTPAILDILSHYQAKATFFVLGQSIVGNEAIFKRTAAEGHQIGVHTWSHPKLTLLSDELIQSEIEMTQALIQQHLGQFSTIFRAPYGDIDARVAKAVQLPAIEWSVDTLDWKNRHTEAMLARVKADLKPGGIILMHDIHQTSVDALPTLLDYLKQEGYTLVTIDELLGKDLDSNLVYLSRTTSKNP